MYFFYIHRNGSLTSEEIVPDLTVKSASSTNILTRFPSDLLETSVDPDNDAKGVLSSDTSDLAKACNPSKLDAPTSSTELESLDHGITGVENQVTEKNANDNKEEFENSEDEIINKVIHINPSTLESSVDDSPKVYVQKRESLEHTNNDLESPLNGSNDERQTLPNKAPILIKDDLTTSKSAEIATSPMSNNIENNIQKTWGPVRIVEILRDSPEAGLGISIVGGRMESINISEQSDVSKSIDDVDSIISGIFIKSVIDDSPAGRTCQLFTGDHLLQVDDIKLSTSDQLFAVQAIKNAGNPVKMKIRSLTQQVILLSFVSFQIASTFMNGRRFLIIYSLFYALEKYFLAFHFWWIRYKSKGCSVLSPLASKSIAKSKVMT